jgi:hypothetical protein
MATATKEKEKMATKVVIDCLLCYAHVWEPTAINDDGVKKYSVACLIKKSDKKQIKQIEAAVQAAIEIGKVKKFEGKVGKLELPLRDGDEDKPDDENYEDCYYINAKSTTPPGIVDANCKKILDRDEVYSGIQAKVSITFFPYNTKGNKGIAAGLNHVMKIADGERIGGRQSAEADFGFAASEEEDDSDIL